MRARPLLLFVLLLPLSLRAQTADHVEVFGGYSYLGYYTYPAYIGPWTEIGYNGFEASATFHLLSHLAAETDFTFQSGIQTYMGGPRVSAGLHKATLYGHVLFGGLRNNSGEGIANTTFATALGGGADYWLSRRVGARLLQADYLRTNTPVGSYFAVSGNHGNFRISTGVVFRF